MFSQFRARYPTGSLTAELVTIYQGKYIVRALVEVEGTATASALAAAETVEQAEDLARTRVLALLELGSEPALPETPYDKSPHAPTPDVPPPPRTNFQRDRSFVPETFAPPTPSTLPGETAPSFGRPPATPPTSPPFPAPPPSAASDDWLSSGEDSSIWEPRSKATADWETPPLPDEPLASDSLRDSSASRPLSRPVSDFTQPLPFEDEPAAASGPLDLSDALIKIDDLLKRLNWGAEYEREYLKRTFNKAGRSFLDPPEVEQFLDYLELFVSMSAEIKRLGWGAEQGRNYLQRNYKKSASRELTLEELRDFVQYLQSQRPPK